MTSFTVSGWGGAGSSKGKEGPKAAKMTPEAEARAFQFCLERERVKNAASRLQQQADALVGLRPQRVVPATFAEAASRCELDVSELVRLRPQRVLGTLAEAAAEWEWVRC